METLKGTHDTDSKIVRIIYCCLVYHRYPGYIWCLVLPAIGSDLTFLCVCTLKAACKQHSSSWCLWLNLMKICGQTSFKNKKEKNTENEINFFTMISLKYFNIASVQCSICTHSLLF